MLDLSQRDEHVGDGRRRTRCFSDRRTERRTLSHHGGVVEVLVIEDEVRLARALGEGLESRGFTVTLCHNGHSGYQRAKERGADVIVLDLMLPDLSGAEVCSRLRAEGVWTPILVLTARDGIS